MKATGKIIAIAYPDTFVKMSTEFVCKVLPFLGIGTKEYIKAGHAALIIIDNKTGAARYYDFGRYVTPPGKGRVRGPNTDNELHIPFKAKLDKEGNLANTGQFLLWLDAHPHKTHGSGRIIASVCDTINYNDSITYINQLQTKGSIPYGAFDKQGSNCARFVTDAILAGNHHSSISKALRWNKLFTPSTVGNVEKASLDNDVYEVINGVVEIYKGTALKENLSNYFDKKVPSGLHLQKKLIIPCHFLTLEGVGSSAHFEFITNEVLPKNHFRIKRYNEQLEEDFDGVYFSNEFNSCISFDIVYDSHCAYCHILQKDKKIKLTLVASFQDFNSLRRVQTA